MRHAILLAVFLLPMVTAQSGDPGDYGDYGDYDDYSGGCMDGVDVDRDDPDELSYEYYYICDGTVNVADFSFEIGPTTELSLEAAVVSGWNGQTSEEGAQGNVAAMDLNVAILGVAVFEDTDGDGAFGPDDEAISELGFSSSGWSSIRSSHRDGVVDFDVDYDLDIGGTFRLVGTAQVSPFTAGGIRVQPGDTKIDFEFHDVPFPSETAKLALVLGINSEVANVQAGDPHGIQGKEAGVAIGGAQSAYFAWAKTAQVDGQDRPVRHYEELETESANVGREGQQVQATEVDGVITLAYEQGSEIIHDPRLGVAFSKSGSNGAPGPGLLIVPLLLAAAALRRR